MDATRVANRWLTALDAVRWQRAGEGWKFADDTILAFVLPFDDYEEFRDRNIPSWNELTNDGEMFADGIPELMEQGAKLEQDLAKWQAQGWWPNRRKVKRWQLSIVYRPRKMSFEADFDDANTARRKGEQAIESVRGQKRPPWLQPVKVAGSHEVERLGALRAFWLFNSTRNRVYGVLDSDSEGEPEVGMITWNRKSNTWEVVQFLDDEQNKRKTLGAFTASDAREGVKRALMTFQEQRVRLPG